MYAHIHDVNFDLYFHEDSIVIKTIDGEEHISYEQMTALLRKAFESNE